MSSEDGGTVVETEKSSSSILTTPVKAEVRARFNALCAKLNLFDDSARDPAWNAWERVAESRKVIAVDLKAWEMQWFACVLYASQPPREYSSSKGLNNTRMLQNMGVSLSQLLRETNMTMLVFFDRFKHFADVIDVEKAIYEHVLLLEKKFIIITVVYQKYYSVFWELFSKSTYVSGSSSKTIQANHIDSMPVCSFCWTLFLLAKGCLLGGGPDLVHEYHLLICCLTVVVLNVPIIMLFPGDVSFAARRIDERENTIISKVRERAVLEALCTKLGAQISDVEPIFQIHFTNFFLQSLSPTGSLLYNVNTDGNDIDEKAGINTKTSTIQLGLLDGLLNPKGFLNTNVAIVNREYEAQYLISGDFDERLFLTPDSASAIDTPSKVNSRMNMHRSSRPSASRNLNPAFERAIGMTPKRGRSTCNDDAAMVPCTPLTGRRFLKVNSSDKIDVSANANIIPEEHNTPVTLTLEAVCRLRELLSAEPENPNSNLVAYFTACSKDPTESIEARLTILQKNWSDRYIAVSTIGVRHLATDRFIMGRKLYFRVLTETLQGEARRLGKHDFTDLLHHDLFHRSLLACCLEVIIASYRITTIKFPFVVNIFSVSPYDFCKVIEPFICNEPCLTRQLIKHLSTIEERILESLAWAPQSPIYIHLLDFSFPRADQVILPFSSDVNSSCTVPPGPDSALPTVKSTSLDANHKATTADTSSTASLIFGSPRRPTPQSTQTTPIRPTPMKTGLKRSGQQSLNLFLRKVYYLGQLRMKDLCARLAIQPVVMERIWTIFEYCLSSQYTLLRGRHLDQILLCSIYAAAKVSNIDVSFKNILNHYREQPHSESHVYRRVPMVSSPSKIPSITVSTDSGLTSQTVDVHDENVTPKSKTTTNLQGVDGSESDHDALPRDTIIAFYNQVFVPCIKDFVNSFPPLISGIDDSPSTRVTVPMSPVPNFKPQAGSPYRQKVSSNQRLFVAPLGNVSQQQSSLHAAAATVSTTASATAAATMMTPRTKALYNFGESPAPFTGINHVVKTKSKSNKRLFGEDDSASVNTNDDTRLLKVPRLLRKYAELVSEGPLSSVCTDQSSDSVSSVGSELISPSSERCTNIST